MTHSTLTGFAFLPLNTSVFLHFVFHDILQRQQSELLPGGTPSNEREEEGTCQQHGETPGETVERC